MPQNLCQQGYYCSGGATNNQQHDCLKGHMCPTGSPAPVPCGAGYYQDQERQWSCTICPPGYYCDNSTGPVVDYKSYRCITGHYCPQGTKYSNQHKCPPGTFNNQTGDDDVKDCRDCTGRFACDDWGLSVPNKLCSAGYFCRSGANMTTPRLGVNADICPPGYYCPEGIY